MSRKIDFDATWNRLSDTVTKVVSALPLNRAAWNERFSDVYSICIAYPETLGETLYSETSKLLCGHIKALHNEVAQSGKELLSAYSKHWLVYSKGATYLDLLYHHFNAQYIKKSRSCNADIEYGFPFNSKEQMLEIGELALECWKDVMIEPLKDRLVEHILLEIARHRDGELVQEHVAHTTILSFVTVDQYKKKKSLQFYEDLFEKSFLQQTGNYYRAKANELLTDSSCSDYMKQVLWLLTEEEIRSRKFLHQSTYKKATLECQQRVIFDHVQFLQAGCREMIRNDRRDDLLHMYMLLKSAPDGLSHMALELEAYIRESGLEQIRAITGSNIPTQFVETVLEIHQCYHSLVHNLFREDKHFIAALDKACTAIVNSSEPSRSCRAAELVCKYCDSLLRRCAKGPTDEADEKLKNSITVFRYIDDKDVFQKFYSRALAKRLINSNGVMDMEEQMINRLKDVCGYDFTSKLHSMFNDVRLSVDHTKKFHESMLKASDPLATSLTVNILQAGSWPLHSTQVDFIPPENVIKCVDKFEKFYHKQHNGRNLTWLHHLSQAEVKMITTSRSYFITMSTYQLAILLLFNDVMELTLADITASTHLKNGDLDKNVTSLLDSNILKLKEANSKLSSTSLLVVNDSFSSKRARFKVSVVTSPREQATEVQQTHAAVEDDRKMYLQAAIVRIIKARKLLHHNSLVEEVITKSRLRFTPTISAIKRAIETLIDKGYIERSIEATDLYKYMA